MSGSPTVEAVIERVIRAHRSGDSKEYYVDVHQELAPLARAFEVTLRRMAADHPALAERYDLGAILGTKPGNAGEPRGTD